MKIEVTLNSLYKWAVIEENYVVNINTDEELQDILKYFGVEKFEDIDEEELGQFILNNGELLSQNISKLQSHQEDTIIDVIVER